MLEKIKTLLGITDADVDPKLNLIIELTSARFKTLLGCVDEIPEKLEYIVVEVSIIRFNRIGSEGITSHSVEGESQTFTDDDFKGYSSDIQAFLEQQKDGSRGKVRFI